MVAAHIAETGAAEAGAAVLAEPAGDADAVTTVKSASPAPLVRVLALSAARLTAAGQAAKSVADLSVRHLPSPSLIEQLPVVVAVRRRAGEHWNTTDSSRPSDFALCYRFSRVMGLQVVPGDLTPSKLPTPKMLSVKNQGSGMGVLVGMTFRLGRMSK
ncbi:hypothetical protein GCM10022270_19290 [Terriglobus aquaticus]